MHDVSYHTHSVSLTFFTYSSYFIWCFLSQTGTQGVLSVGKPLGLTSLLQTESCYSLSSQHTSSIHIMLHPFRSSSLHSHHTSSMRSHLLTFPAPLAFIEFLLESSPYLSAWFPCCLLRSGFLCASLMVASIKMKSCTLVFLV